MTKRKRLTFPKTNQISYKGKVYYDLVVNHYYFVLIKKLNEMIQNLNLNEIS